MSDESWGTEALDRIDRMVTELALIVASRVNVDALRTEVRAGFESIDRKLDEILRRLGVHEDDDNTEDGTE